MKYFKDNQGQVYAYEMDGSQDHLIQNKTTMSDAEILSHTASKPNDLIRAQIRDLEAQVSARLWREYITKPNTPAKNGLTPAEFITNVDTKISALRALLV